MLLAAGECSRKALAAGALEPLLTESLMLDHPDGRVALHLLCTPVGGREVKRKSLRTEVNPFLPYDERVFVADISASHVCLLNKFPVFAEHLLIVTREWEDQAGLLRGADFDALWRGLVEVDGLAFYNGGANAGASLSHRHLQIVPFVDRGEASFPWIERLSRASLGSGKVEGFNFPHAVVSVSTSVGSREAAGQELQKLFLDLRLAVGLTRAEDAYNLLLTREWMFLVPRDVAATEGLNINSLGFVGSLFLREREQVEQVRRAGLPALLRAVAKTP